MAKEELSFKEFGKNIELAEDEIYLYFRVKKETRLGVSKSGKSISVGTTSGNMSIGEFKVGMNVYVPNLDDD